MKILYFNLVEKIHTRDSVYLNGLKKLGVEIVECRDWSPGLKKFRNLYKKHRALKNDYDVLLVGFSGHILVPFARLISRKKIIFNALSSLYDGIIMSRKKYGFLGWRVVYCWLVDWLAFNSSDLSFVDSNSRKKYIMRKFFIPERKLVRLWTGVDDDIFKYNPDIKKLPIFTVLYRGGLLPESGIDTILQAANTLRNEPIKFRIMGTGYLAPLVEKMIKELDLKNVEWITRFLPWQEMVSKMQECHLSIGQISSTELVRRQPYHVAFKTLESMALKIPYVISSNNLGILEFLTDRETCIVINPADAEDLARTIIWARDNYDKVEIIAENAYNLYRKEFTQEVLARKLLNHIYEIIKKDN